MFPHMDEKGKDQKNERRFCVNEIKKFFELVYLK
jgi:hypothetical protein